MKLVGVPVSEKEIQNKFKKRTTEDLPLELDLLEQEVIRVAKLNFVESQHPRMLGYVECRSDPVFYLVESVPEPEPELDLDDLAAIATSQQELCRILA